MKFVKKKNKENISLKIYTINNYYYFNCIP